MGVGCLSGSLSLGADFVFWAQSTPILQMNTVRLREGKGLAQDLKAVRGRAGLAPCPPSHSYLQYHHRSSKCFLSFPFIPVVLVLSSRAVQHAGSLVPQLEIKPSLSAVKAPSSSHWATRESPHSGSHARRRFKLVTCVDPLYHTFRGEVGLSRAQLGGEGPGLGCTDAGAEPSVRPAPQPLCSSPRSRSRGGRGPGLAVLGLLSCRPWLQLCWSPSTSRTL